MNRAVGFSIIFLIALWAFPKKTIAQDAPVDTAHFAIEDGILFLIDGEKKEAVALPSKALAVKSIDKKTYVALGEMGLCVLVIDDSNKTSLNKIVPVSHGSVTGFVEVDGELWMRIDSTSAVKINPGSQDGEMSVAPLVAPVPKPSVRSQAPVTIEPSTQQPGSKQAYHFSQPIKILEIFPGEVELNIGVSSGVKSGDSFSAYRQKTTERHGKSFDGEQLVAVLEIVSVGKTTSFARVWKGDRVHKGDRIAPSQKNDKVSLVYPGQNTNIGEVSVVMRPLVAVSETGGFGMLNQVTAAYWTKSMFFDVGMTPLGMAWTDDGNILTTSILGHMGYNSRPFAIGLGAGVAITPTDMGGAFLDDDLSAGSGSAEPEETKWSRLTKSRFALSQRVRLGARGGLCFTINNHLLWVKEDENDEGNSGFVYGGTTGKIDIPIAARVNLFLEGGGGVMGYGFGDIGIFAWLRGNGDKGSIGLSASGGFAMVWGTREKTYTSGGHEWTEEDTINVGGPMISVGFTYRFGF